MSRPRPTEIRNTPTSRPLNGSMVTLDLAAIFGFGQQQAGDQGAQSHRQADGRGASAVARITSRQAATNSSAAAGAGDAAEQRAQHQAAGDDQAQHHRDRLAHRVPGRSRLPARRWRPARLITNSTGTAAMSWNSSTARAASAEQACAGASPPTAPEARRRLRTWPMRPRPRGDLDRTRPTRSDRPRSATAQRSNCSAAKAEHQAAHEHRRSNDSSRPIMNISMLTPRSAIGAMVSGRRGDCSEPRVARGEGRRDRRADRRCLPA